MLGLLVAGAILAVAVAGVGVGKFVIRPAASPSPVPSPPLASLVPANFTVETIRKLRLDGGPVPVTRSTVA